MLGSSVSSGVNGPRVNGILVVNAVGRVGKAPPGVPLFGMVTVANVMAGRVRATKTDKETGMKFMVMLKKIFLSLVDRFLLVEEPY
jgi:hypothetical protein